MDVFLNKIYRPMLIGREGSAFDDDKYIFELKLDGIRCLAYINSKASSLITRGGLDLFEKFPELAMLQDFVSGTCILDGELVVLDKDAPSFELVKTRAFASGEETVACLAQQHPVTFVVFDLLYRNGATFIHNPLELRREILESVVTEYPSLAISRIVHGKGVSFFEATKNRGLEGIIGKRTESLYYPGKRTKDWIKCKNIRDDDFIICGFIINKGNSISIVLGQYDKLGKLVYRGRVVVPVSNDDTATIKGLPLNKPHDFTTPLPYLGKGVRWIKLKLVCRVEYLEQSKKGLLRHPVYKGLRMDKNPEDTFAPS